MPITIRSIETAVPPTVLRQDEIRDVFAGQPDLNRLGGRLVRAAFDVSGIETRHTVVDELDHASAGLPRTDSEPPVFYDSASGEILSPSTGTRNDVYTDRSPALFLAAARTALDAVPDLDADDVTHVVTVSCTGFFAPGPDYAIVRGLGLRPSTQRYHLGFMGCYGAFPALRAARSFCLAEPDAVVLVVCVELCSLHLASSNDPDTIVASSVFADGAAAAVVTARPAPAGEAVLDLDAFETVLTPVGEKDMAWTIGDHGFEMVLSRYVPHIIEEHIAGALAPLLASVPGLADQPYGSIPRWAIHPGGRSILDKVQSTLDLSDDQLDPSRETLRTYGNMSSATILFVLRHVLHDQDPGAGGERVCAMAFGPGLTVETALLTHRVVDESEDGE
ncbi:putative naringenin-chalcone synthase [Sanguibacter antarcticus]|uniref:Putative naringenin-chalcone synthase n=2 Tax=Sanguibacter antarcticus TaxID=372484 RepID=A0A2A9E4N1_9MICO|nr:putative naringenin-chalcone synthase [Sanguibacter antarcticus]